MESKKYYKAFNPDMTCRGKQYAENTVYEEKGADGCCQAGVMHFCENPFDCLSYYPLVNKNGDILQFAEVEPQDEVMRRCDKCATKRLKIGARLGLKGFVEAAVNFIIERTESNSSGDGAQIGSGGYGAQIGSGGDGAQIGSSGYGAQIGSSGYGAQIGSSGDGARIGSSGKDAVVAAIGRDSAIKAELGSWIVLAEYDENGIPLCVKSAQIDGGKLKPNTLYTLKNGKFVEV